MRGILSLVPRPRSHDQRSVSKYNGKTTEVYGTPYYITIEERDQIADYDLSATPSLEAQRDIFIFQCLIGCRVSDLMAMTPRSIINGAIEYMPQKTKGERPKVVRVPSILALRHWWRNTKTAMTSAANYSHS